MKRTAGSVWMCEVTNIPITCPRTCVSPYQSCFSAESSPRTKVLAMNFSYGTAV